MPALHDYQHFGGRHWETGSVHNYYAYRGVTAPHTGQPYSEAFLLGASGGIAMGYFTFAYEGYDPQCNILTRNTFDPLDRMLSRLGIVQELQQTALPDKAVKLLEETLADGAPAIVWADLWSLPYNGLQHDEQMWGAFPIVVYGCDRVSGTAYIADRAGVPLTATLDELAAARGRIKKDKYRLLTLDLPDPAKLESAVRLGIADCIKLFTDKPPKGTANNFGLAAFRFWAEMLTKPKARLSWEKLFPPGIPMYAGLTSAYSFACLFGKGEKAEGERSTYADFLEEAAILLGRPALREAATAFRQSARAWSELPAVLLPEHIQPFAEARRLLYRRHHSFLAAGNAALPELQAIDEQLATLRTAMQRDFPLTHPESTALREQIAAHLLVMHNLEEQAVAALQSASI